MKNKITKIINKTTAYILSLIFVFLSTFSVSTFAYNTESGETRYNENTATYYFTELIDGFGTNSEGTCAYVASAMLLSYYDSFWNDDIISENYEEIGTWMHTFWGKYVVESAGIKKESRWVSNNSCQTYGEYIDENSDEYFHLELIRIGRDDLNFYYSDLTGSLVDLFGNWKVIDRYLYSSIDWSISVPQARDLIEHYLEERGIISNKITVNCLTYKDVMEDLDDELSEEEKTTMADAEIRQQVIDKVNNGVPVVYAGFNQDSSGNWNGHALIAYDYDSTNDELIFHSGWVGNTSLTNDNRILRENDAAFDYREHLYMMWLDINTTNYPHVCSYNYNFTAGQNQRITCMCSFSIHPNHRHDSSRGYISYDTQGHNVNCFYCDKVCNEEHFYSYILDSATQHKAYCDCGYEKTEYHVVRTNSITGLSACIYCGAFVGSSLILNNNLLSNIKSYITDSGSYIADNGVIYLSDIDANLILSGQMLIEDILSKEFVYQ